MRRARRLAGATAASICPLTEYAWRFRYPGEPEEPTEDEARAAIEVARKVYAAILARLPVEAHP